jgi:expansin
MLRAIAMVLLALLPFSASAPTLTPRAFLPLIAAPWSMPTHTGEGTYYAATGAGNCMFDPSPTDLMVAAMNHVDYAAAAICGAYVEATGPLGTVTVRIVDQCPECPAGDIDFSQQAFARIAHVIDGRVPIRWRIVSPALSGTIAYRFKEGSNQWWTAVQVRNHRNPIAKLEYRQSNGTYKAVTRTDYNYFVEASGMGPGPYAFRVTDIYSHVLTDTGIPFVEGGVISGTAQFPRMP